MPKIMRMAAEAQRPRGELLTALAHLYRGEVARADVWRSRLDNTTNWALTTAAGVVSIGLSSRAPAAIYVAGMFLVLNFLFIETRRYRTWDVYLHRVRLMETALFAPLLREEPLDAPSLRELASTMDLPRVTVPFRQAIGQRVKRAYGPVLVVLLIAWFVALYAEGSVPFGELIDRMAIGFIPGWLVGALVLLIYLSLGALAALSILTGPPSTEVMPIRRHRRPLSALFESIAPRERPAAAGGVDYSPKQSSLVSRKNSQQDSI